LLILNGTCLDVIEEHRAWLNSLDAEIIAEPSFRTMKDSEVDAILAGADALILPAPIRNLPLARHMEKFTTLKTLSIAASGYDWLDVDAATRCGIAVTFAPVPEGAEVVADMTFGLMLAAARQIPHHHELIRNGDYSRGMGVSLWKKTLGIVGLGNIGRAVARRAAGFEMKILAVEPYPNQEFVRQHGIELVELDDLLQRSDFVSLHVRLDNQTEGMIGKRELSLMKPSAFLINAARQKLVDEAAMTEAVLARRIAGAAMDDPPEDKKSPLFALPNFVCAPHLGNRAIEGVNAVFKCAVENAITVLHGQKPKYLVNPAVYDNPSTLRKHK
jgi:D-3-phosphoglycerate dehydrogenase